MTSSNNVTSSKYGWKKKITLQSSNWKFLRVQLDLLFKWIKFFASDPKDAEVILYPAALTVLQYIKLVVLSAQLQIKVKQNVIS